MGSWWRDGQAHLSREERVPEENMRQRSQSRVQHCFERESEHALGHGKSVRVKAMKIQDLAIDAQNKNESQRRDSVDCGKTTSWEVRAK